MVDETGEVAALGGINDGVMVDAEEVAAANANCFVFLLAHVSDRLTHHITHVLDNHLLSGDWLQCKQSPVVNATPRELQLLLAYLLT